MNSGAPLVTWDSSAPVTIALDGRVGRIEGQLVTSDSRELQTALGVRLVWSPPKGDRANMPVKFSYSKSIKVGGDGRFAFDGVAAGRCAIIVVSNPDSGYEVNFVPDELNLGSGEVVNGLRIPLKRLLTITGRVVDAVSGEPIAGVRIDASLRTATFAQIMDDDQTDDRGRYTVLVRSGTICVEPSIAPKRLSGDGD